MSQFFSNEDYLKFLERMQAPVGDIDVTRGALRVAHICMSRWKQPAWSFWFDHVGFQPGDRIPYTESWSGIDAETR